MANLTRKSWPLGWVPSQDRTNGDRNGLLQMQNVQLDENSALTLTNGTSLVNSTAFGGYVHTCFSKFVDNTKWRYAALSDGTVLRGSGENSQNETEVIDSSGDPNHAAFDSTLGNILIFSGSQRKREVLDSGSLTTYDITPETPASAPTISSINQPLNRFIGEDWPSVAGNFSLDEGANLSVGTNYVQFDTVDTGATAKRLYRAVVLYTGALDTKPPGSTNPLQTDGFSVSVRPQDTAIFERIRIEFVLDDMDTPLNYYWKEWENSGQTPFLQGKSVWSTLTCNRSEFTREGGDSEFDWNTVVGLRIVMESVEAMQGNAVSSLSFIGGEEGQLNGLYDYIQVNVSNKGYLSKSVKSDPIESVYVFHGRTIITPVIPSDPQVNEIWIYRRSSDYEEADTIPPGSKPQLETWYRVATINNESGWPATVEDNTSDKFAKSLDITYNDFWVSVLDYPDDILDLIGDYNGRTIYMTFKEILISADKDPGLVDSSASIVLGGDPTQKNLWLKLVHPNLIYVGTTDDIHLLQGTLLPQPNGSVDVINYPLGVDSTPIAAEVDEDSSVLYFMTADGWRGLQGSSIFPISSQLKLLYEGKTRYDRAAVSIYPRGTAVYPVVIGKGKLWASVPHVDGTRGVHVYDFTTNPKYWYFYYINPICLFAEEDGKIIGGFNTPNHLKVIDDTSTGLLDGSTGQNVVFETIADDDELPRNRKDTFTIKLTMDTGGGNVDILLAKEGSNLFLNLGTTTFSGKTEKLISIAETFGFAKNIALKIVGTGLSTFKFYNFTIEYDPRPEQLTYLRIPNTNLNTVSRKRFFNFPFVIDTLGTTCEFLPLIDNVAAGPSSEFSTASKLTYIHYFFPTDTTDPMQSEFVGTDIGGIICGFFEFYGVNFEEIVSEKLPVPAKSLLIPGDDYGVPNRKRHSSYKFQINTRGQNVQFIPRIDQTWYSAKTYNTSEKQTVEYFFTTDTIGIDIGGRLDSLADTPFEFYGTIRPQEIEVLPARLEEFRIPENNLGHPAKKRVRTLPMVINTNGQNVTFTPIVDQVSGTPTTLNTPTKQTAFHYFTTDSFGIDYSGELVSQTDTPFEFYGLMNPVDVEVLPVAKKFDQIGPLRFDRLARISRIRLRVITEEISIPIKILTEGEATLPTSTSSSGLYTSSFTTVANTDDVYEIVVPKSVIGTVFRFELGPTSTPFHRYDLQVLAGITGGQADQKWIKVK